MARLFTLLELRTAAKRRADMENRSSISDDEWDAILSTAYASLYSIVVKTGFRYFEASAVIVTDGVDNLYPLPSDHLSTIGVDWLLTGSATGQRRELAELMIQERNYYAGQSGTAYAYALSGQNLALMPKPPSGQSYEHIYVPQPDKLTTYDDTDEVDVVTPEGEDYVTWYAAVIALHKEESDTRKATEERDRLEGEVHEWAILRALHQPRRRMVEDFDGGAYDPASFRWNPA